MKTISTAAAIFNLVLATADRRRIYCRIDRERKSHPQHTAKTIPVRSWVDE